MRKNRTNEDAVEVAALFKKMPTRQLAKQLGRSASSVAVKANAEKSSRTKRKPPSDDEHRLQSACFRWFALQHPHLQGRLFAVPNGGQRNAIVAARLKDEGVLAGVSDLILLKPSRHYGALLIEMKTPHGHQSQRQRWWQQLITADDEYRYVICRSLNDFISEVNNYLNHP